MIHVHIAIAVVGTEHTIGVLGSSDSTVVIGCSAAVVVLAVHHHASDGEIVLLGEMPGQSETCKKVVAPVLAFAIVALILVGLLIVLVALAASLVLTVTEADVGKSVEYAAGVVDITAGVPSAIDVGTGTQRTVIAGFAVALQHDIDDTGRTLGREFGRGIVDDLDALDALGRYLLQYLGTVV